MKKNMLLLFQIFTMIIIILLALSTFFVQHGIHENYSDNWFVKLLSLDHFYNSPINVILFTIIVVLMLISIFIRRLVTKPQIILHVVIALAFLVIIFDKSSNYRVMMPIMEGETVNFSDVIQNEKYTQKVTLQKFNIEFHEGSSSPKAYTSLLKIDDNRPVELNVNHPVKIGSYRLYQNSYENIPVYSLKFNDQNFIIKPSDELEIDGHHISLQLNDSREHLIFCFNEHQKAMSPLGGKFTIEDFEFELLHKENVYSSGIEVASVKGMRILLVLGLGYLASLGFNFWRNKS